MKARTPYLLLAGFLFVLDRWTKSLIHAQMDPSESLTVVDGFFDITYVRNTGIAFGMLASVSSPLKAVLLSMLAGVAVVIVMVYSFRNPAGHRWLQASLALVLGGALGNLYDRMTQGYVTDFLDFYVGSLHWPAFNVADLAISAGVVLLAVEIVRHEVEIELSQQGLRLDVFLSRHFTTLTRSRIQALNRAGAIQVDGQRQKAGYRLRGGEVVEIVFNGSGPSSDVRPEPIPLEIIYEDDDVAVVEKSAGIVVHPAAGNQTGTLVHSLLYHFGHLSAAGGKDRPGIVHRLDKWTSGLMVIAKSDPAHVRLAGDFQERRVQKTYIALVHGRLARQRGTVELGIGRHPSVRTRMAARVQGRPARTEYVVMELLPGFSLLRLKMRTGRTHQIRVHLSAIGHPVVGDRTYGRRRHRNFAGKYPRTERFFLHASELCFLHPTTRAEMRFCSPLPAAFAQLLEEIKSRSAR